MSTKTNQPILISERKAWKDLVSITSDILRDVSVLLPASTRKEIEASLARVEAIVERMDSCDPAECGPA